MGHVYVWAVGGRQVAELVNWLVVLSRTLSFVRLPNNAGKRPGDTCHHEVIEDDHEDANFGHRQIS